MTGHSATRLFAGVLFALTLGLLTAACSTSTRPLESVETRAVTPLGAVKLYDEAGRPLESASVTTTGLAVNAITETGIPAKKKLNILALSGGGADGAFGAGVLYGWSRSGKRPQFDIVTGVSTGALMSVMAFIGPSRDEDLKRLYTRITNSDIYRDKGFAGMFSASLYDYTPLKRQISQVVDDRLLDEIAAGHRAGRRLYVATTNLDAGKLVVWDIGAIAASNNRYRLRVIQKILRASAAVPGFFKPVYIQPLVTSKARQMHVDGSVKAPVLVRSFMFKSAAKARNKTLYIIVNGHLRLVEESLPVKPEVMAISRKSITELLRGLLYKTLYQAYVTTRNARGKFRLTAIPANIPASKDPLIFRTDEMNRLFTAGERIGLAGGNWMREPPRLQSLQRVGG